MLNYLIPSTRLYSFFMSSSIFGHSSRGDFLSFASSCLIHRSKYAFVLSPSYGFASSPYSMVSQYTISSSVVWILLMALLWRLVK